MALSTSASACEVELKAMRGAFASGWRLDRLQGARREERGVKSSDAGTSNCETRSDRPFGLGPSSPSASPTASVNTGAAAAAAAPLTFVEALVEAFVPFALATFFLKRGALSRASWALLLSEEHRAESLGCLRLRLVASVRGGGLRKRGTLGLAVWAREGEWRGQPGHRERHGRPGDVAAPLAAPDEGRLPSGSRSSGGGVRGFAPQRAFTPPSTTATLVSDI